MMKMHSSTSETPQAKAGFRGLAALLEDGGFDCPVCGRRHAVTLRRAVIARGALEALPASLRALGVTKAFLLADPNTWKAAGARAAALLEDAGIPFTAHVLRASKPAPDEATCGEAMLYWDPSCDGIVGVGGGVINDTSKILACLARRPYLYVGTAPSMDGYAFTSSSMERDGLKTTIAAVAPDVILADTEVLRRAPRDMILSGVGDMAAKYVSLAEWRMASMITGEYYCAEVARMMQTSVDRVTEQAAAAVQGDADAVAAVTEGLIVAGLAMTCAGISRPASGVEHYISHIRDMRSLAFGTRADWHGIQCGWAVLPSLRIYEKLRAVTPDRERALAHARDFDYAAHAAAMRRFIGPGAEAMIALEAEEKKYDAAGHAARLARILSRWDELRAEMEAMPSSSSVEAFYRSIGFPTKAEELGMTEAEVFESFRFAGDIRDKYVLTRLLWDLGIPLEEMM